MGRGTTHAREIAAPNAATYAPHQRRGSKGQGAKEAFPPSLSAGHSFGLGMTRTLGYAIVLILAYHTHPYVSPGQYLCGGAVTHTSQTVSTVRQR